MISIWEGILLGSIQGLAEWLPISSEAMVSLFAINVLGHSPTTVLSLALLLHVGTVLSAVIYFRSTIIDLLRHPAEFLNEWRFLMVVTMVSGLIGGLIYLGLSTLVQIESGGAWLTIVMGLALLLTAYLLSRRTTGLRSFDNVNKIDGLIIGIVQGLAVIPGISRSGSTIAVGLWRRFNAVSALTISFLVGIPLIVIGAVALMITGEAAVMTSAGGIAALVAATVVGYVTIDSLLRLSRRVNFATFVLVIGVLSLVAGGYALLS